VRVLRRACRAPRIGALTSRITSSAVALALAALTLCLVLASVPLTMAAHESIGVSVELGGVLVLPFAAVGAVVARREPRNPVGWVLLLVGLLLILCTLGDARLYLRADYGLHHGTLPLGALAILAGQAWPAPLLLGPLAILLFPDGRLPPRWRLVVRAYVSGATVVVAGLVGTGLAAVVDDRVRIDRGGDLTTAPPAAVSEPVLAGAFALLVLLLVLSGFVFVVRQVVSYHRSTGDRRQQLKWVMCGGGLTAGAIPLFVWHPGGASILGRVVGTVVALGIAALPLSIGVAILKFRLYEIDRLISRTLSYAIVTAVLLGVYLTFVALTAHALPVSSPVAVALATLTAAVLFNPLRTRVQRRVDRRFNRARYDAETTVERLAANLRDAVDPDSIASELLAAVHTAFEPSHTGLWLQPVTTGSGSSAEHPISPRAGAGHPTGARLPVP
jgi:hypothetical protein